MKSARGIASILIVLIIIISTVGGAAALFGYQKYQKIKAEKAAEQATQPQQNTPIESPCGIPEGCPPEEPGTTGWMTYVNNTHKYSIKYPPNWQAEIAAHGFNGPNYEPVFIYPIPKEIFNNLQVGFSILTDPPTANTECKGTTTLEVDGNAAYKEKTIKEVNTIESKDTSGNIVPPKHFQMYTISACFKRNNNTYSFWITDKDFSKEQIFDQILSTFKFLE